MSWITPKTDWKYGDCFDLDPDYERIKGNIEFLYVHALKAYTVPSIKPMANYTIYDLPTKAFYSAVEDNTATLCLAVVDQNYTKRVLYANGPAWRPNDLNRIEDALSSVHSGLRQQLGYVFRCGTGASCGQARIRQVGFRAYKM